MFQTYDRKKENFSLIKKIVRGFVRFSENTRGNVIEVGSVKLSSSCEFTKVYLVHVLKHNLLSISKLCDASFGVLFKAKNSSIKYNKRDIPLIKKYKEKLDTSPPMFLVIMEENLKIRHLRNTVLKMDTLRTSLHSGLLNKIL